MKRFALFLFTDLRPSLRNIFYLDIFLNYFFNNCLVPIIFWWCMLISDHLFSREVFAIDLREAENYCICEQIKSKEERETV